MHPVLGTMMPEICEAPHFLHLPLSVTMLEGRVSRPAGYPGGPLRRTRRAELPHPAPDRSMLPHTFQQEANNERVFHLDGKPSIFRIRFSVFHVIRRRPPLRLNHL